MQKSTSTYIGFGQGIHPPTSSLSRSRSFILRKIHPLSRASSSQNSKSRGSTSSSTTFNIQSLETDFNKIQKKYKKIFTRNIRRLEDRRRRDERKLENFQMANLQLRVELKREIELLEDKYGPRRTSMIYQTMTKERESFFKKIEKSLKSKFVESSRKFEETVRVRFQSAFDFGIDLLQMPSKDHFIPPTHASHCHPYFSNSSSLQREVSFNDFITSAIRSESFIHFLTQSYSKDLANISDRAKSDTPMDQMEITFLKSLLRTLLRNQVPSLVHATSTSERQPELQYRCYFTDRLDFKLSNLKIAYLYYYIYKRTGEVDRALRLIVKAVDANIESLSVYLEFFVKYFQIFEYINEVFPNRFKKKTPEHSTTINSFKKAVKSALLLGLARSTNLSHGVDSSPLPITFNLFFERLTDFRSRFEYIYQTYKYLSSLFSLAEIKEMLLEVADSLLKARQYFTAQRYYLFIVYMFEHIDVFELYKTRGGMADRQSSKQEAIQRTYSVLRLNQKIFQVNNKFIEVCLRTKSYLQALIFIISNHFLYKNSMKQIEEHDPSRYPTKNPNKIILQDADEYELNIEEKNIFQKLYNSFKNFYKQTLELHRSIWEAIKEDDDKVKAGSLTRYRNLLERLDSIVSYDKKSYLELLESIKVKFSVSSLDQANNSIYVPHFLGYTKKRDHINYITEKIHKVIGEGVDDQRRKEQRGFSRETASSNKKREEQINVEDIERYLDVRQEDSRVLDLILRVGLLYLYQDLRKSPIFTIKSYCRWTMTDWQREATKELHDQLSVLQSRVRKFLKKQREKRRQLSDLSEVSCSPVELRKRGLREKGEACEFFVNEFGRQHFVKKDKSQFYKVEVSQNLEAVKELGVFREIGQRVRMVRRDCSFDRPAASLPSFSFIKDKQSYEPRRQSILATNESSSAKKDIDIYFQKLKSHFEHSYIDQEHSITTINRTVFRFSEVIHQRQLSFGISTFIRNNEPLTIRLLLPGQKSVLDHCFIDLIFQVKSISTSRILQSALKSSSFKFYTFLPALHSYLTKEYFSRFFGVASPERFKECGLATRVGESLKQMGLVFSLVLIDFPSFRVNDLQSIDIGLFNHFDYSFLQSFLAIGRFLLNFLLVTKTLSVFGHENKKISFEKIFSSGTLVNRTGDAIVLRIYCQKLFIFAQRKMIRSREGVWSGATSPHRTEDDSQVRCLYSAELDISFKHSFQSLIDFLPLVENLRYILSIFRNSNKSSCKKDTLRYPLCFLVSKARSSDKDSIVSFNFVVDLSVLDDNYNFLKSDLGKLINRARVLDPPLPPNYVFDTMLLRLANSFIKAEVRVLTSKREKGSKPLLLRALAAENVLSLKTGEAPLHFPLYSSLSVTQVAVLCLLQGGPMCLRSFKSMLEFERDHLRLLLFELLTNPTDPVNIRRALLKAWQRWELKGYLLRSTKSDQELTFDYKSLELRLKSYVDVLEEWTQSFLVPEMIAGPAKVRLLFGKQIFSKVFHRQLSSNRGDWTGRLEEIENEIGNVRLCNDRGSVEQPKSRGIVGSNGKRLENLQRRMEAQLNARKRCEGKGVKVKDFDVSGDVIEVSVPRCSLKLIFSNGTLRIAHHLQHFDLIVTLRLSEEAERMEKSRFLMQDFGREGLSEFSVTLASPGQVVDLTSKVTLSILFRLLDPSSLPESHLSEIIARLLHLPIDSLTSKDNVRVFDPRDVDFKKLLDHNLKIRNLENLIFLIKRGEASPELVLELERLRDECRHLRSLDHDFFHKINLSSKDDASRVPCKDFFSSATQHLRVDTNFKEVTLEMAEGGEPIEIEDFPRSLRNYLLNKSKSVGLDHKSLSFLLTRRLSDLDPLLRQTSILYHSFEKLQVIEGSKVACKVDVEFVLLSPSDWASVAASDEDVDPVSLLSKVVMKHVFFPTNGLLFRIGVWSPRDTIGHSLLLSSKDLEKLLLGADSDKSWNSKLYFKSAVNSIVRKLVFVKSKIGNRLFLKDALHLSSSGVKQCLDKPTSDLTFVEVKSMRFRILSRKVVRSRGEYLVVVVGVFKGTLFVEWYNSSSYMSHFTSKRIVKSEVTSVTNDGIGRSISNRAFMRTLRRGIVFDRLSQREVTVLQSLSAPLTLCPSLIPRTTFIGRRVYRSRRCFYNVEFWLTSELLEEQRSVLEKFRPISKSEVDHFDLRFDFTCQQGLPFKSIISLRNAYKSYMTQNLFQNKMVDEKIALSQLIEISELCACEIVQQSETSEGRAKRKLGGRILRVK